MPRIYIAGPMTGLPAFNFPAFDAAEKSLRAIGHDTLNPARHGAGGAGSTWADYMRRDIADLLVCEGVALLPDWRNSRGASLEYSIATELGMDVREIDEWFANTPPGPTQ